MLEFFATSDEVAQWVSRWISEHRLSSLLVRRRPFAIVENFDRENFDRNDTELIKALLLQFDELLLGLEPLEGAAKTATEVAALNPDRLEVHLPRLTDEGLRAGGIGSVSRDSKTLKTWRSIAKDVLDNTTSGMWMVNLSIPAKRLYPDLRYSPGAAAVHSTGVNLLTFAAETPVFIAEPEL
jgi:hypothetical protein